MIAPKVSKAVAPSAGGRVEPERSATGEAGMPAGAAGNEAGAGGAPGKKAAADALRKDAGVAAPDESVEKAEGGAVPPAAKLDEASRGRLEGTAKLMALKPETAPTEQTPAREESSEFHGELQQKPQASAAPRALAKEPQALAPGYAAILSRYGLPPLWDGARVSPEALANAEPELRSLYVSGAAGNDSARVRLYVAEAVRLRYAPGDSTLYDEILRHYRRAIDLAGPDAETARVAEERLRTLER